MTSQVIDPQTGKVISRELLRVKRLIKKLVAQPERFAKEFVDQLLTLEKITPRPQIRESEGLTGYDTTRRTIVFDMFDTRAMSHHLEEQDIGGAKRILERRFIPGLAHEARHFIQHAKHNFDTEKAFAEAELAKLQIEAIVFAKKKTHEFSQALRQLPSPLRPLVERWTK